MNKAVIAALALGCGLVLTGCGLGDIASPQREEVSDYTVTEKIVRLRVDSGSGDIVVNGSDRTDVRVIETLHWRGGNKPTAEHRVEGDLLLLDYTCKRSIGPRFCSVDYKIEVPAGVVVTVGTGSGEITLRDLSGDVRATAGSGTIDAAGLSGGNGLAKTGSGDVELRYTSAPREVRIETGSGDATVRLPQDTYAVDIETGVGDEKVEVDVDPSAKNRVIVQTGSGDAFVLRN